MCCVWFKVSGNAAAIEKKRTIVFHQSEVFELNGSPPRVLLKLFVSLLSIFFRHFNFDYSENVFSLFLTQHNYARNEYLTREARFLTNE